MCECIYGSHCFLGLHSTIGYRSASKQPSVSNFCINYLNDLAQTKGHISNSSLPHSHSVSQQFSPSFLLSFFGGYSSIILCVDFNLCVVSTLNGAHINYAKLPTRLSPFCAILIQCNYRKCYISQGNP